MDQHIKGADGGELTGDEWLALNAQNRAIAVEYSLTPVVRDLANSAAGKIIARRFARHRANYARLAAGLPALRDFFAKIARQADPAGQAPFWENGWFPPLDAISLCVLLNQRQPRRYVEVGSGNSTKFARALIANRRLMTEIISIDPSPRADIDGLCDRVIRSSLEAVHADFFASLTDQDMLFIDSSHRSFQNSDVTVFFTDVFPGLADGTVYGIHDIFLPYDYPESFVNRFYNEQYLLAAYLIADIGDDILFPVHYVARDEVESVAFRQFGDDIGIGAQILSGGAFWAQKARTATRGRQDACDAVGQADVIDQSDQPAFSDGLAAPRHVDTGIVPCA